MTDLEYLKKYLDESKLEEGITKLKQGIPVQYIVGNVDFYGLNFKVDERVLIPRFETEELVSRTSDYIQKYFDKKVHILDIGTGSGCIAISLEKNLEAVVDGVDISESALDIAKQNNAYLNANVNFFKSDMLNSVTDKYDVIISNPPYIAYNEEIMDIVKNNEPHLALYADDNGLEFYKKILENAKKHLKTKSLIAFEIGASQKEEIISYAKKFFQNSKIWCEKDLADFDRFIFIYTEE